MPALWEKIITREAFQKKNTLPETPGVYFFLGENRELLYIGKATSLRDRVKSYFSQAIALTRGPKIGLMFEKISFIGYRAADSVLEALILETNLIKAHQPPYNTDAKDDKSYNHVVITREKFPRVLVMRGRDIAKREPGAPGRQPGKEYRYIFGPFPAGGALREAMKIVRRLFPFRDKCLPYEELASGRKKKAKACFSAQIGLCPGVCTGAVTAKAYARTINHIRLFFEGRKNLLTKQLEREMKAAAKTLAFERAGEIKRTLFGLRHIRDMALVKDDLREVQKHRIEAYDVAHLGGDASVGVMAAVEGSRPAKESYRKFRLRGGHQGNDLTALQEILERRFKHPEWPVPDIIVVDGAEPQRKVAEQALLGAGLTVPVVGVVKNAKHQPERLIGAEALLARFKKEILLANSEAHRFAITFHRARRDKEFL